MWIPLRIAALAALTLLVAAPADAWGTAAHKYIMRRAIELLPPELKPFFVEHREEVVLRATDPDTWRSIGWEEDPHHFLDFGAKEFGPYPFTALPRDYSAALEKFGRATLERYGLLPWRAAEMFGNLRRGLGGFARESPYASLDAILFSAVTAHYVQDAHQPLHATINYDGQETGQYGVHARFERDLFERFESRLVVRPAPPVPIADMRTFAFDTLLASYRLVDPLLAADKAAAAGKETYDDEYFERFLSGARPILEQRLAESISNTAALIIGAWEAAGRPTLRLRDARPVQKVRQPK